MKDFINGVGITAKIFVLLFSIVFMITLPIYAALKVVIYLLGDL